MYVFNLNSISPPHIYFNNEEKKTQVVKHILDCHFLC